MIAQDYAHSEEQPECATPDDLARTAHRMAMPRCMRNHQDSPNLSNLVPEIGS
jgi:hypothetical protein